MEGVVTTTAPEIATVSNAGAMIDLFNSAASKFLLIRPGDQQLYETYFKALVNLSPGGTRLV